MVYESRLELARLLLADFDPAVQEIFAQPCRLAARVGDQVRHHVPDFLLVMCSGTVRVVNVKPADRLQDPKIAKALAWPGELIRQHGWDYEIWSGANPVLLENVQFLAAYRRPGVVSEAEVAQAWEQVVDGEELALAERRLAGGRPPEEMRLALMALLWSGRLTPWLEKEYRHKGRSSPDIARELGVGKNEIMRGCTSGASPSTPSASSRTPSPRSTSNCSPPRTPSAERRTAPSASTT